MMPCFIEYGVGQQTTRCVPLEALFSRSMGGVGAAANSTLVTVGMGSTGTKGCTAAAGLAAQGYANR